MVVVVPAVPIPSLAEHTRVRTSSFAVVAYISNGQRVVILI